MSSAASERARRPRSLAARITLWYVAIFVAMFLGWAFAGEEVTRMTLVAAAVILAGVALITTTRRSIAA